MSLSTNDNNGLSLNIPSPSSPTNNNNGPLVGNNIALRKKMPGEGSVRTLLAIEKRKSTNRIMPTVNDMGSTRHASLQNNGANHATSSASLANHLKQSNSSNNTKFWNEEEDEHPQQVVQQLEENQTTSIFKEYLDKYLMFVQALKLERSMHPLLCLALHILIIAQTLVLGTSLDFGWGVYGRYILNVAVIPRTFGFQYLPYEGYIGLAATLLAMESIIIGIIYLTYRSLIYGTSYWKRVRTAGRIAFATITLLSLPITFALMHAFFDCDYENTVMLSGGFEPTYVLRRFKTVQCWGIANLVLGIVSWLFCFVQIVLTVNTVMIFCDTTVNSKGFFVVDNPFLVAFIIGSNQVYNIVAGTVPHVANYLRPIMFIVLALVYIVILFRDLPFLRRVGNSIYGGVGFARLAIGISSLISTIANPDDRWDIGLGITFTPFVLGFIGFIIGFIVTDIYTRKVLKKGQEIASIVTRSSSTHELTFNHSNLPSLSHFLKFSLKGNDEQKDLVYEFIRIAYNSTDLVSTSCLINMALCSKDMFKPPNYFQATTLLKKAENRNPSIFEQYNIFMRVRELEYSLSMNMKSKSGVNETIIERMNLKMKKLRLMIIEFWKSISSNSNVDHILQKIQTLSYELDVAFENLILEHDEDETIINLYSNYQREFNFQTMAEVEELEETEKKDMEPPSSLQFLSLPHTKTNLFASEDVTMLENMESVSVTGEDENYETVLDKQQEIFTTAINKPDEKMTLFYFLNSSGLFQLLFIAMLLIIGLVLLYRMGFLSMFENVAVLSPLPFSVYINMVNLNGNLGTLNTTNIYNVTTFRTKFSSLINSRIEKFDSLEGVFTSYDETIVDLFNREDKTILIDGYHHYSKNTSSNWISKRLKKLLSSTSSMLNRTTSSTLYPLQNNQHVSFLEDNVGSFSDSFNEFFESAFQYLTTELNVTYTGFIITTVLISVSFIVYSFIHSLFLLRYIFDRRLILKLFSRIPIDESRLLITTMEKVVGDDQEIRAPKKSILSSISTLIILDIFSIIITIFTCSLIIADVFQDIQYHTSGIIKLRELSLTMKYSQIVRYDMVQMVLNLKNQTFRNEYHDRLLSHITEFDKHWMALRYGTELDNYKSLSGINSNLDNTLSVSSNCSDFSCLSLDSQIGLFRAQAAKKNELLKSFNGSLDELSSIPNFIYNSGFSILDSLDSLNDLLYYNFFTSQPFLTIIGTVVGIPLLLFCYAANFNTMNNIRKENHALRKMLNYLHWEILDSKDDLRNYIFHHTLNSGSKDTSNKRKIPKERAILEAALTSSVVCSANGTIDIFNNASEKLFGYRSDQMIGFPLVKLFDKESEATLTPVISKMSLSGVSYSETMELVGVRKNLNLVSVELRISVSVTESRNIITCFIRDLTELKQQVKDLAEQKKRSEALLMNIMPYSVAKRLQEGGSENLIADKFDYVTCLFSEIVGLLDLGLSATDLVQTLNDIILPFDEASVRFNLEKIKTIGSKYFCTGGLKANEMKDEDHEMRVFEFALNLFEIFDNFMLRNEHKNWNIGLRAGINSGPLVAGVCGVLKYAYDIWGDAVNTASRMEYLCPTGCIQVTEVVYSKLKHRYTTFEEQTIEVKGKGVMKTYVIDPAQILTVGRTKNEDSQYLDD